MRLPPSGHDVERAVEEALELHSGSDLGALAAGVAELSRLFTRQKHSPPHDYLADEVLRSSYLAYFFPVNLAKVRAVLGELPREQEGSSSSPGPVRVLDLGSGPGPAAIGCLTWLRGQDRARDRPIELVLVDRAEPALALARDLVAAYRQDHVAVHTIRADLERRAWLRHLPSGQPGGYHLIVLGNCLNELYRTSRDACTRRAKLVEACLELLSPHGSLIVLEPASRPESRALHRVRDQLLARRVCNVYSPCLRDQPCPALEREDDWCHEERLWTPPRTVAAIDGRVGFIKDALKFSYLVLRRDGRTIARRHPDTYRVVSELRVLKGERRAWLCNAAGRQEVGRLDRERSEANAPVDQWHRGAIVRVDEIARKDVPAGVRSVGRIRAGTPVRLLRAVDE